MRVDQLALDCEPDWTHDDEDDDEPHPAGLHDLRGQGLTETQLHTITDIPLQWSYL